MRAYKRILMAFIMVCMVSGCVLAQNALLRPVSNIGVTEKVVVLTFDDGPHPVMTPQVLDILKKYKVKAVFFMIAQQVKKFPDIARRVKQEGHEIGTHSIYHHDPKRCSESMLREEIGGSIKIIEAYTGVRPRYYRPPYGRYDQRILEMAKAYDLIPMLWDADAYDYHPRQSSRNITYYILKKTRPGSIIILHEKRQNTLKALPFIIEDLRSKGYRFILPSQIDEVSLFRSLLSGH